MHCSAPVTSASNISCPEERRVSSDEQQQLNTTSRRISGMVMSLEGRAGQEDVNSQGLYETSGILSGRISVLRPRDGLLVGASSAT